MNAKLELKNVSFSFGKENAINDFSLSVEEGSFTTLLGPSGCGKTTLLRLISGFLTPDSGEILIDGVNQNGIEVNERKVGFVFQDYALFPHLSVEQNIAYGLKIQKKLSKTEISDKISVVSSSLGIEDLLSRNIAELSGGQQQRVALARSLILEPKILLMDEPLSSLDTKLRIKVREELKEIQHKLHITTVYVTHDQEEALSLSTKIAVLNKGELLQAGTPRQIYFEPKNVFTADFVGKANILKKSEKRYMIRPEWFKIAQKSQNFLLSGTILSEEFLGSKCRFIIQCDSTDEKELITADFDTIECENLKIGSHISFEAVKFWEL
ncbi:ABC transporter ATP-binding protein [Treponema sp.]|uniref:ABC transporter ATP-binding protein n=1 Tax=Treponema sp. TaxID=166 RepID=UPI0038902E04